MDGAARAASEEDGMNASSPPPRPHDALPPLRLRRTAESEEAWAALPTLRLNLAHLRRKRIVTLEQRDEAHMAYDMLRTRILHRFRKDGRRSLALTSPAPGCGKTLTCLNLAFSFARQSNCRTLVLDLDLRRPRLASMLGVRPEVCVSELLAGRVPAAAALNRAGGSLAFGLAKGPVRYSSELLHDERTADALAAMTAAFAPDVILYDLPPLLASDDAAAFLSRVDGALLVAAAGKTTLEDIDVCGNQIAALTEDLGVVLNKSAFMPRRYYGYGYGYGDR